MTDLRPVILRARNVLRCCSLKPTSARLTDLQVFVEFTMGRRDLTFIA
jgi:hypothetical protein